MYQARNLFLLIMICTASIASGVTLKPECTVSSPVLITKCSFPELEIDTPLYFQGKSISTKYVVTYDFSCSGHTVSLGLGSLDGRVPLEMGASNTMISVVSDRPISMKDLDATSTRVKSFRPGCSLEVSAKSKYPSNRAIISFAEQAKLLTQIINKDLNLVQLSTAFAEINNLTSEEFTRLRDMTWDYLDFAIEDAGIDDGISYFSDKDYEILSVDEMEAKNILSDWEDLTDDYPSISDLVSVLNFALQNLDSSTPIPSPLGSDLIASSHDALSKHYKRKLRKSIRQIKMFLSKIQEFVDYMDDEDKAIIKSLRSKIEPLATE